MKIIVIGAGLAGSATAHALAVRGCDVTVLEASPASSLLLPYRAPPSTGLPVALMAPHHSVADQSPSTITQLSRLGLAATTAAARSLLVDGQDWSACGALQRAGKLSPQAHWFADAAWVKPAALVAAWLTHPRITLRSGAAVQHLQRLAGATPAWQAVSEHGRLLAEADALVLANGYGASALLEGLRLPSQPYLHPLPTAPKPLPPSAWLHQVAGQVVVGPWTSEWQALWPRLLPELAGFTQASHPGLPPVCAINGNGHFIPAIPWGQQGEQMWLSGSTYEHDAPGHPQVTAQGLATNLQRLQQLIPAAAHLLAAQQRAGQLQGWAGTRCTTRDRLPAVGAVSLTQAPGLYACTAMGSRGLSFAALCGQHVASLMLAAQVSPLPAHLHRAIDVQRFAS
jgi:tRNA 5-methylaminomethyl-2-thiouridine biosynthesis bifunctional protein